MNINFRAKLETQLFIFGSSEASPRKTSLRWTFSLLVIFVIMPLPGIFAINCDSRVKVESREILSYLANVTFSAPTKIQGGNWTLDMKTTYPFTFIGGWDVELTSDPRKGTAIFHGKENATVYKGDIISFRFRIHYGTVSSKKIPYVSHLQWDKSVICEGHAGPKEVIMSNDLKRRIKSFDGF